MYTKYYLTFLFFSFSSFFFLQAVEKPIDSSSILRISCNSESENAPLSYALDGDSTTWWISHQIPTEIILESKNAHHFCGFSYTVNSNDLNTRLSAYEVYIGKRDSIHDSLIHWKKIAQNTLLRENETSQTQYSILWGPEESSLLKILYTDNTNTWNQDIHTRELVFYEDPEANSNKKNQLIYTQEISPLISSLEDYPLQAHASSGLKLQYSILPYFHASEDVGPFIEIVEKQDEAPYIKAQSKEGYLLLLIQQEGNNEYYPCSSYVKIQIQNPSLYTPIAFTPLSEIFPIEMDSLYRYTLHLRAEVGAPAFNHISTLRISCQGEVLAEVKDQNYLRSYFTPSSFAWHTFDFYVQASNGRDTSFSRQIEIRRPQASREQRALDRLLINFPEPGRERTVKAILPQHIGAYKKMTAKMQVNCPEIEGGCDDWDRVAWIEAQAPDGNWHEIIRYITPFGVACKHQLDISDFSSILQGEVNLRMFVDTWGTGGWETNLDIIYDTGTPQYIYSEIQSLWSGNFPFGDPSRLQPLDTLHLPIYPKTEALNIKLVSTGHGWGANNSKNAAEFYRAKHQIKINQRTQEHDLWMLCNPNPDSCLRQRGTWQHNRSGWCPGAIAPGYNFNASDMIGEESIELAYIFDTSYIDLCHPNHPNCISGKTCADCNDGFNPQYYISSYLISYSKKMFDSLVTIQPEDRSDISFSIYPNPVEEHFYVSINQEIGKGFLYLIDSKGSYLKRYGFSNASALSSQSFSLNGLPSGVYMVQILSKKNNLLKKIIKK